MKSISSMSLVVAVVTAGCVSPPAEPLDDEAVVRAVAARDLEESGSTGEWNAAVRRARATVDAAEARARSAGWPGPVDVGAVARDPAAPREGSHVTATFDVLGALGLGPAREELVLAVAELDRARAALVEAAQRATFDAAAAAVRWEAARGRREALDALIAATHPGASRIAALRRAGRVGEGVAGRVAANLAALGSRARERAIAEASARAEYARVLGVTVERAAAPSAVCLGGVPAGPVDEVAVLRRHPALTTLRAGYGVAEARLRRAAAGRWPRLRVGPRLTLSPDRLIPGGVLSLEVPVPGSLDGEIEAAVVARRDARGRLEDALVSLLADIAARRAELEQARAIESGEAAVRAGGSRDAWRAANAILSVREGLGPVETWLDALQLRAAGVLAPIDAHERSSLAALALLDARGEPLPGEKP